MRSERLQSSATNGRHAIAGRTRLCALDKSGGARNRRSVHPGLSRVAVGRSTLAGRTRMTPTPAGNARPSTRRMSSLRDSEPSFPCRVPSSFAYFQACFTHSRMVSDGSKQRVCPRPPGKQTRDRRASAAERRRPCFPVLGRSRDHLNPARVRSVGSPKAMSLDKLIHTIFGIAA